MDDTQEEVTQICFDFAEDNSETQDTLTDTWDGYDELSLERMDYESY